VTTVQTAVISQNSAPYSSPISIAVRICLYVLADCTLDLYTFETFVAVRTDLRMVRPFSAHSTRVEIRRSDTDMQSNKERTRGMRAVSGAVISLVLTGAVSLTACQGVSAAHSPSQSTGGSTGQLSITPATIAVGNVSEGSSGTATATLSASGNSVTLESVVSDNSAFTMSGLSLPLTIAAGQSASFTVTFSPMITGAQTGALTFTSNAQTATTMAALTGTGTAASTHSVALSWNASTSANILGYNVYRAVYTSSSCGSYSKVNSVLNTGTIYTDFSVTNATSYCYTSTAVNTSNEESAYSNVVSNVQVP
jgi:hypothetical protein